MQCAYCHQKVQPRGYNSHLRWKHLSQLQGNITKDVESIQLAEPSGQVEIKIDVWAFYAQMVFGLTLKNIFQCAHRIMQSNIFVGIMCLAFVVVGIFEYYYIIPAIFFKGFGVVSMIKEGSYLLVDLSRIFVHLAFTFRDSMIKHELEPQPLRYVQNSDRDTQRNATEHVNSNPLNPQHNQKSDSKPPTQKPKSDSKSSSHNSKPKSNSKPPSHNSKPKSYSQPKNKTKADVTPNFQPDPQNVSPTDVNPNFEPDPQNVLLTDPNPSFEPDPQVYLTLDAQSDLQTEIAVELVSQSRKQQNVWPEVSTKKTLADCQDLHVIYSKFPNFENETLDSLWQLVESNWQPHWHSYECDQISLKQRLTGNQLNYKILDCLETKQFFIPVGCYYSDDVNNFY